MRAAKIVRDFFDWRWAPCVGLIVGSLTYVGLAVLLIPSQLDPAAPSASRPTGFEQPAAAPNTAFASSLTQGSLVGSPTVRDPVHRLPLPATADAASTPRRGFSPPIEQPPAPPPPPPPPIQP